MEQMNSIVGGMNHGSLTVESEEANSLMTALTVKLLVSVVRMRGVLGLRNDNAVNAVADANVTLFVLDAYCWSVPHSRCFGFLAGDPLCWQCWERWNVVVVDHTIFLEGT